MARSPVIICNQALSHLGNTAGFIESLTEKSTQGRLCLLWYDTARAEVLEAQDWSFARRRVALPLHSEAPVDPWAYRYQMPQDCIVARRLWNPAGPDADAVPFELLANSTGEAVTLLTNLEDAELIYTRDVTVTDMFSPLFSNALAHFIAAKIAYALTGKMQVEQKEMAAFQSALRGAGASDASQGAEAPPRDADWVRARA